MDDERDSREVLLVGEAALLLRVSTKTLMKLARSGEIPGRKVGRAWRFSRTEVMAWLARRTAGAA